MAKLQDVDDDSSPRRVKRLTKTRKTKLLSSKPSSTTSTVHSPPLTPQTLESSSAAPKVLFLPEIRQKILSLLERADLARFLRVYKGCMREVTELLYKKVSSKRALYGMNSSTVSTRKFHYVLTGHFEPWR